MRERFLHADPTAYQGMQRAESTRPSGLRMKASEILSLPPRDRLEVLNTKRHPFSRIQRRGLVHEARIELKRSKNRKTLDREINC